MKYLKLFEGGLRQEYSNRNFKAILMKTHPETEFEIFKTDTNKNDELIGNYFIKGSDDRMELIKTNMSAMDLVNLSQLLRLIHLDLMFDLS